MTDKSAGRTAKAAERTKLLRVTRSTRDEKKKMAVFEKDGREQTVHFGQRGADDYTKTKDKEQRSRYRSRHAKEKNQSPNTPGALAYHLLWGESTSFDKNLQSFKRKHNL